VIDLKRINVPVFLVYAGIIHAIGLALLMPMLVTLPGPGSAIAPKASSVDVELAPAEADSEQTSALPASPQSSEDEAAIEAGAPADVANVSPEAEPEGTQDSVTGEKPAEAEPPTKSKAKTDKVKSAKPVKKPVAQRSRPAKPAVHRSVKKDPKIAPFNGALTGLFTPGAPAKRN
jgi:hypothetical protein